MSSPAISVATAQRGQFDAIVALLAAANLPTRDLNPSSIGGFLVAIDDQELVGAVALERYGEVGLLRSLVVAPGHRSKGTGSSLVVAIEECARNQGVTSLVLLTETASKFFADLGYTTGRRDDAPESVKASSEFAYVCPVSAVYMDKRLR
jgi:amino-acid N-acetyltransferase